MSHLVLDRIVKKYGAVTVVDGIDLSVPEGESLVLLGPSGCGKTTCLRMIAGFERPDAGSITLGDRTLVSDRTYVPAEKRGMAVVFQNYALWPHMTVFDNVAYGPRTAKADKKDVRRRVGQALDLVQLGALSDRYIHQLSGGQQQRIALARAMVNDPALLLLDEPLSNLDTRLREEMRIEIKRIQRSLGVTMVYVTHDQAEALSLADRLVVMNAGTVGQTGSPEDIYRHPRTSYVARALGTTNIVRAVLGDTRDTGIADVVLEGGGTYAAAVPTGAPNTGSPVALSLRPNDVRLSVATHEQAGKAEGKVVEAMFFGDSIIYLVDLPGQEELIKATTAPTVRFGIGDTVALDIAPSSITVLVDEQL
ncbi:ATP-binding cassette domain-containing protein [Nakamurella sp. YIM 132087]|uniref:ABC-type quaternary amine transporter n=1 Tax=Nakamurella alba TaxID=2665158 RepID=A0A7K1FGA5_9ACTN|nr:ABC transporter ATP-binding protein [Nakamurella alba]MTD12333.1 ATP-binding cassette domain-containing protein [Nakamurella alba]